jgi:hypothetical protein
MAPIAAAWKKTEHRAPIDFPSYLTGSTERPPKAVPVASPMCLIGGLR